MLVLLGAPSIVIHKWIMDPPDLRVSVEVLVAIHAGISASVAALLDVTGSEGRGW